MFDTSETAPTELVLPDGTTIPAEFYMRETTPELVELSLRFLDRDLTQVEQTFFAALILIREDLEKENILIRCYGSSKNVYPSGMSLSMGTGDMAHKLKLGQSGTREDTVWIFDTGPDVIPATIKEQRAFFEEWCHFKPTS